MIISTKKKITDATSPISYHQLFILSEHRLFTYPASCVSILHIQNLVIIVSSQAASMAVSLAAASAVADKISAVLALGHLFGLPVGNAEIADGHDTAILAAYLHIGTLFLAAE